MEEYSKSDKLVPLEQITVNDNFDDEIRLYTPKKREYKNKLFSFWFRIWRFFAMVIAFFLIYYCLYQLYVNNAAPPADVPAAVSPEETTVEAATQEPELHIPLVINESKVDIKIEDYLNEDFFYKFPQGEGVKVLIVNSHSSERVSGSLSVADLAEDLKLILESRGIGTYFDGNLNDSEGMIGAYSRMADRVVKLKNTYSEAVIVIDLHDSDSGSPVTFTIGTSDGFAWQENLRLSCCIYKLMKDNNAAIRLLPASLGQDNGLLTLNVGIGGDRYDDGEVRARLTAIADALSELLKNEPLA